MESRIQDCLGFPYKGRLVDFGNGREYLEKKKWENRIVSLAEYADSRLLSFNGNLSDSFRKKMHKLGRHLS